MNSTIEGQLDGREADLLRGAVLSAPTPPQVVIEVGTWLGGGSTLTFLRALEQNGLGHLWGIEANPDVYERMMHNLNTHAAGYVHRFTPLFGLSEKVLPEWIAQRPKPVRVDLVFLDGGNNPMEQMKEFELLDPLMPVGAQLFAHDARQRKGKFFVPFLTRLDNWQTEVHDFTEAGMLAARKTAPQPSPESLRMARARVKEIQSSAFERLAEIVPPALKILLVRSIPQKFLLKLYHGAK